MNVFTMSLLDLLSCAFGAVVVLAVLVATKLGVEISIAEKSFVYARVIATVEPSSASDRVVLRFWWRWRHEGEAAWLSLDEYALSGDASSAAAGESAILVPGIPWSGTEFSIVVADKKFGNTVPVDSVRVLLEWEYWTSDPEIGVGRNKREFRASDRISVEFRL